MQSTHTILMVRPAHFGYDPATADSNAYQRPTGMSPERVQERALDEFDGAVHTLRQAGVDVLVYTDTAFPVTPNAIFPNNWFSTHARGDVISLYPMETESRRAERDPDVFRFLEAEGLRIGEILDWSSYEIEGRALEGTGSLVLDRIHGQAFACRSSRTDAGLVEEWAREMDYFPIVFDAVDGTGRPIYHTNVMMAVGTEWAVVCADAIPDAAQRRRVLDGLDEMGRRVVKIDGGQMAAFAGNMLEVRNAAGEAMIVLSRRAKNALRTDDLAMLEDCGKLVALDIPVIEQAGGGSVRCMMAEIFLGRKPDAAEF